MSFKNSSSDFHLMRSNDALICQLKFLMKPKLDCFSMLNGIKLKLKYMKIKNKSGILNEKMLINKSKIQIKFAAENWIIHSIIKFINSKFYQNDYYYF